MKKFLIFKKLEDGSYAEKLGSYDAEAKDDSSANRSYLQAEPLASHFELPAGLDEDCVDLVWQEEIPAVEAQVAKWTKEGQANVFEQPMIDDGAGNMIADVSWTFVPAVEAVAGVPAQYVLIENAQKVADKSAAAQAAYLDRALSNAIAFGAQLMKDFTKENMAMGITQDNMTGTVRKNMIEVISALQTGSLYDAITEVKAIPAEAKDPKYITNARLLTFVNRIEEYLGIPLSQSL